jgi:hypothetical protein
MTQKTVLGTIAFVALVIAVGYIGFLAGSRQGGPLTPAQNQGNNTPTVSQPSEPTVIVTITPTATPIATPTATQTGKKTQVTVYHFSKPMFNKPNNVIYWEPVIRETTRVDVATFALEELIKGPMPEEINQGLGPTFGANAFVSFADSSNCSGKDFTIAVASEIATVKFCRGTLLSGDMSGYVVTGEIAATLKKFSTIKKVIVLNKAGQCFDDMRGETSPEKCVY